ncbi:MAG TPA: tetratricopeptide repeat protein [Thermoanaerobaculia bacterium]
MAPGLSEIQEQSPEAKHRLYSGHASEVLAKLETVLAAPGPAPVLILSGEPGCGRTGLLEAAAQGRARVLPLDLDGFEEGLDLARFAAHQISKRWELEDSARERLARGVEPLLGHLEPSLAAAAAVSLLLRLEDPATLAWGLTSGPTDGRKALTALLERLTRDGRLVLHVLSSPMLTDPLRARLLREARERSGLLLALSCSPKDGDDFVAPRAERLRLELQPLPAEDLLATYRNLINEFQLEISDRVQRFLDLAALCGENVPAGLLFHHLEWDEEQQEELLDLLDEELVESEKTRLFTDHQYTHPSFPGLQMYSFLSPLLNHVFLEPLREDKRQRLATELLDFVDKSVPLHTRGMALLRLSLAGHAGDAERRLGYLRDLRIWIGENEVDDLADELAADIREGILAAGDLFQRARESEGRWPPHVRLALAEAVARDTEGFAPGAITQLSLLRAETLREVGRKDEALQQARQALEHAEETHGPDHLAVAATLNMVGILEREAGDLQPAREHLERALEIQSRDADPRNLSSILANLGLVLRDLGQREAARDHLMKALDLHRQIFGDVHPAVASDLNNLAMLAREMGDVQQALEFLRPVVDILRQMYGDVHPYTSQALTNVAGALRELGDAEGARTHLEAALQIDSQVYGEQHPQVIADLNNLAVIERELGNTEVAREHFETALAMAEGALGGEHPLTVQLRRALGG